MAGIFGDRINSRREFFSELAIAQASCRLLIEKYPEDATLVSVRLQLDAISQWTDNGRTPTADERESIDMGIRVFREYETTDDADLESFSRRVSVLHSYVKFWPTDKVAADDDNDEYLSLA
jgi:site-specific recombinase XerD